MANALVSKHCAKLTSYTIQVHVTSALAASLFANYQKVYLGTVIFISKD